MHPGAATMETESFSSAGERAYHAFISYSHRDRDILIARSLQKGLQRLAKPFWQPQLVRVYRDETSLPADPALRGSLIRALDQSKYLIVVCSPESAGSTWVKEEVDHWLDRHGIQGLLLVLCEGELVWDSVQNRFDPEATTALIPSLFNRFSELPYYVDLRQVKTPSEATLKNSTFLNAVATLAATLLSVPKDQILRDEIKSHRMMRLAAIGTAVIATLAVLSGVVAAIISNQAAKDVKISKEIAQQASLKVQQRRVAREFKDTARQIKTASLTEQQLKTQLQAASRELGINSSGMLQVLLEVYAEDQDLELLSKDPRGALRVFHVIAKLGHLGEVEGLEKVAADKLAEIAEKWAKYGDDELALAMFREAVQIYVSAEVSDNFRNAAHHLRQQNKLDIALRFHEENLKLTRNLSKEELNVKDENAAGGEPTIYHRRAAILEDIGDILLQQGERLRAAGKYDEARTVYVKAGAELKNPERYKRHIADLAAKARQARQNTSVRR
jgi:tetratricopeptide (TPR) repeat protein